MLTKYTKLKLSLQENVSLVTNFSD